MVPSNIRRRPDPAALKSCSSSENHRIRFTVKKRVEGALRRNDLDWKAVATDDNVKSSHGFLHLDNLEPQKRGGAKGFTVAYFVHSNMTFSELVLARHSVFSKDIANVE
ncbi:Aste57867_10838 [Aphanomyces stellatus]|uniref:Aste57867_10838 protein n=1 Tax=Aphanomyces stellatus TaxID=120398 RepID=A0A485KRD5_9STRA|nr:hypothetical protein As57867_010798 [Aphanomyces stellatus]VFT87706.1 Aste57867_10838 [Aphanomyces stellatus]